MSAAPLRTCGFLVVDALNGNQAIDEVLKEQPQCIVLDVVLPKQSGFQLCRPIRNVETSVRSLVRSS